MIGRWGRPLRMPLVGGHAGCPTPPETASMENVSHFGARLRDALSAHGLFGKLGATFRSNSGMHFPVEGSRETVPHFRGSFWDTLSAVGGAAFKDCPKLPAGKERPQVPG